jgi:hypothetical protein
MQPNKCEVISLVLQHAVNLICNQNNQHNFVNNKTVSESYFCMNSDTVYFSISYSDNTSKIKWFTTFGLEGNLALNTAYKYPSK